MKKKNARITTIMLTVLLAVILTSCGEKDFVCGWCTRSVHEKPHEARILGQVLLFAKNEKILHLK